MTINRAFLLALLLSTSAALAQQTGVGGVSGVTSLTGDCTGSGPGATATTCLKTNGVAFTAPATAATTGSGNVVLATSPTLVTPVLGVASSTSEAIAAGAGTGFVEYGAQSSTPASPASNTIRRFADSTGRESIVNSSGFVRTMDMSGLTASRVFTFPDVAGTFALLGAVQTFTGTDTFSGAGAASTPTVLVNGTLFTGGTGTTTYPNVYINEGASNPTTWSTNGTPFGINAPSGFTGNFVDFHINGASSILSVGSGGNTTINGSLAIGAGSSISWTGRGILSSPAVGKVQFGAADAAAPVAQSLLFQSVVAGTSNTAGSNTTIAGSAGTGTGAGGNLIFQTAPAGSTGTSQNAQVTAFTIDSTTHLRSGGSTPTCGTGCASVTGNDTAMVVTTGSAVTSIAVNFNKTWASAPTCTANGDSAAGFVYLGTPPSTTVLTLNASAAFTSDKIYVLCIQ